MHESVHDELVELVLAEAAKVRLGDPLDEATTIGPLNNEAVAAKMDAHVADANDRGVDVLLGGAARRRLPDRSLLRAHRRRTASRATP